MFIKRKSIEKEVSQRMPRKPRHAPINLSESGGVRYLHFGTEWIQGAMRIRRPDWIELEYVQQMMAWLLFCESPQHIVQLGLGTGALTKFCYRQCNAARITAVELNPAVIAACRMSFKLPANDERLQVIEADAMDVVMDAVQHGTMDILQVDLYDASARGPVLDSFEFYQACAACLQRDGIMTVNLFGDHPSYDKNLADNAARLQYGSLSAGGRCGQCGRNGLSANADTGFYFALRAGLRGRRTDGSARTTVGERFEINASRINRI